jgi:hypothetical protein
MEVVFDLLDPMGWLALALLLALWGVLCWVLIPDMDDDD